MEDRECWIKYPKYRHVFNKLWVADTLGYNCGPCGVPVQKPGLYCIRPIYNLDGMSRGVSFRYMNEGETCDPGFFWCEYFEGRQYSIDFAIDSKDKRYVCLAVEAIIEKKVKLENPHRFKSWIKLTSADYSMFVYPSFLSEFNDVPVINIEYIEDKIIEIHLRENPDFKGHPYIALDVVWELDGINYDKNFIESYVDAGIEKRLGFYGK
jgi:hypothetical protein